MPHAVSRSCDFYVWFGQIRLLANFCTRQQSRGFLAFVVWVFSYILVVVSYFGCCVVSSHVIGWKDSHKDAWSDLYRDYHCCTHFVVLCSLKFAPCSLAWVWNRAAKLANYIAHNISTNSVSGRRIFAYIFVDVHICRAILWPVNCRLSSYCCISQVAVKLKLIATEPRAGSRAVRVGPSPFPDWSS